MRVLIVGAGITGKYLTARLCEMGQDVVVIDPNTQAIHELAANFDVMTIKGNGADPELLAASNIGKIDLLAAGSLVMTFFTPDLGTAVSSTIACLGNIGPGLNAVGAVENYAAIPNTGKMVLILLMLLGRLELFTVLVIFLPDFWRK